MLQSMSYGTHSLFRNLTYDAFRNITLNGNVIDLGGSLHARYQKLFSGHPTFTVVNIDERYGYDLKFDLENPFPLADASYDHALCLHVLELVYDWRNLLSETKRILRPGGTLVCVTPFLVQVHHNPRDYFRYTDLALRRMFEETGFEILSIEAPGSGVFAVVYHHSSWLIPIGFLRTAYRHLCLWTDRCLQAISGRYRELSHNYPLGYLVLAKKPDVASR